MKNREPNQQDTDKSQQEKRPSSFRMTLHILLPFAIYFVAHDVAQMVLSILLDVSLNKGGEAYRQLVLEHASTISAAVSAISMLIGLAFIWKMAKQELAFAGNDYMQTFGALPLDQRITGYAFLIGLACSSAIGINIFFQLIGFTGSSETYREVQQNQYGVSFLIGMVLYGIISPLVEEIVFRGLIYNRMKHYYPPIIAIVASSLFFGLYHGNMVQGVYGTVLGLLLACVYEMFHSFGAPFLFHAAANISIYTISYRTEDYQKIVTLPICVISMTITVLLFLLLVRMKKSQGESTKEL